MLQPSFKSFYNIFCLPMMRIDGIADIDVHGPIRAYQKVARRLLHCYCSRRRRRGRRGRHRQHLSLSSLSLSKTLQLKTNENQKTKKNASLFTQRIKFKPSTTIKPVYSTPYFRGKFRRAIIVCLDGSKIPKP